MLNRMIDRSIRAKDRKLEIITERLSITPFTVELIHAAKMNDVLAYKKLGIVPNLEWPEKDLKDALPFFEESILKNGITGFCSWILLDKNRNIVGSVGYIQEPQDGVVEIGFGVIPSQQNKGYCTEAVKALIEWGTNQKSFKSIIAYCGNENDKSKKVLQKVGFLKMNQKDGLVEWELKL